MLSNAVRTICTMIPLVLLLFCVHAVAPAQSVPERAYVEVEPIALDREAAPHLQYDLVMSHEFVAQKPRWRVIQGPEVSLVIHPDDVGLPLQPFGIAGPAVRGTRMLDPELAVLVPYPDADPFTPGQAFTGWLGEGSIESIEIRLEAAEGVREIQGYQAVQYQLEIVVESRLIVPSEPGTITDWLSGELWLIPDLPFTDAVFLPYFHPFFLEPLEVAKYVQDVLTARLGAVGLLAEASVTLYAQMDDDDVARVRQGEAPLSVWPQRTSYTLEGLQQVDPPPYSEVLAGASLIDSAGYNRLLTTLMLFDVWEPCLPLPVPPEQIARLPQLGTVVGLEGGPRELYGDAMHSGQAEPGREAFGLHITGTSGDGVTFCLALLRVGAGAPELGTYRVLPPSGTELDDRTGQFVGYMVGIVGDDPFDPRTHTTFMAFESVSGEITIDEVGVVVEGAGGEWIEGTAQIELVGVMLDDLASTRYIELKGGFSAWEGLWGAPQVR